MFQATSRDDSLLHTSSCRRLCYYRVNSIGTRHHTSCAKPWPSLGYFPPTYDCYDEITHVIDGKSHEYLPNPNHWYRHVI